MRRIKGFTLLEVIIVLIIISIILMSMFKVFRYVMDKKVAYYVYNFYNELPHLNKALEENLRKDNQEYKDQLLMSILQKIDSEGYCKAFTKSLNTAGSINCDVSEDLISNSISNFEYDCKRTSNITITNAGLIDISNKPVDYSNCVDNIDDISSLSCNATPTIKIDNLIIDNRTPQTYMCTKNTNNSTPSSLLDVDSKPLNLTSNVITSNNIRLGFLPLRYGKEVKYNLNAKITQEAVCPRLNIQPNGCNAPTGEGQVSWNNCNSEIYSNGSGPSGLVVSNIDGIRVDTNRVDNRCYYSVYIIHSKRGDNGAKIPKYQEKLPTVTKYFSIGDSCESYLTNIQKIKQNDNKFPSDALSEENKYLTSYYYWIVGTRYQQKPQLNYVVHNTYFTFDNSVINAMTAYYNKWNNFFDIQGLPEKVSIDRINNQNFSEGSVTQKMQEASIRYFIYAAIDKDFSKAEMKKDLFVFEQYGDKIIPVGYLANDRNSPLKFNVYTRSSDTGRVYRIGARNMTYCEAMSYVGGKVSEYCGCKDVNGNIVTEFEESTECGTLGCDLRAVRPNFKSVWLPNK